MAASAAYALTFDAVAAMRKLSLAPERLCTVGVLVALLSSLPAILLDLPFLTHVWVGMPCLGNELSLSTVLLFDLGVYLCVWGALGGYCLAAISSIRVS